MQVGPQLVASNSPVGGALNLQSALSSDCAIARQKARKIRGRNAKQNS